MRSTLFYIPHADPFFGFPLFGPGWILALLIAVGLIVLVARIHKHGWTLRVLSDMPMYIIVGAAIYWIAPLVEARTANGVPLGIPIRAYGMMLLLGIVFSLILLVRQAEQMGLHPDTMFGLAFWIVLGGFLGARAFYVIQYWQQFSQPSWKATFSSIANLTDGGLVVYGSFIGASIAILVFVRRYRLPLLALADLIAPSMMLGLALGRIGCLMNGCCWGAYCDGSALAITFPQGSPPYVDQIKSGMLLDMRLQAHPDGTYTIQHVQAGGKADRQSCRAGDTIQRIWLPSEEALDRMRHGETVDDALLSLQLSDGRYVSWEFRQLPDHSAPVYPAQILSCFNAALICLFLWSYYPFRRRDGEVAALMASIYPVTRILLEMIRTDESSLWDIDFKLTISQAISGLLLLSVAALWCYVLSRPQGSALPRTAGNRGPVARN